MQDSSQVGSFVRQAAILAFASITVRLMGFLYRVPLTHLIGDAGNAYYIAAYRIYTIAVVAISGSMIAALSRLTSERIAKGEYRNAHELFKTAMGFACVLGLITAVSMYVFSGFLANVVNLPGAQLSIQALAPAAFFVSILAVIRGYFQGMKTAKPTAVSQVIEQIVKITVSVVLAFLLLDAVYIWYSAAGAAAGTSASVLAAVIVVFVIYKKKRKEIICKVVLDVSVYKESRSEQVKSLVKTAAPVVVGFSFFAIAGLVDLTMAGNLLTASGEFSHYEIRLLIGQFEGKFILLTSLPISLSMALSAAVLPEIASSQTEDDNVTVKEKADMALRLSMALAFPSAVGISILAYPILALLFPSHPDGGVMLMVGGASIVFMSVVHVSTGVLQGIGKIRLPLVGATIALLVKIAVNFVLMPIPEINILGAVISTIVYAVIAGGINLYFVYKHTGSLPALNSVFVKPFIASIGMAIVCFTLPLLLGLFLPQAYVTVITLAVGLVVYLALMVAIKGFYAHDLVALPIPSKIKKLLISS